MPKKSKFTHPMWLFLRVAFLKGAVLPVGKICKVLKGFLCNCCLWTEAAQPPAECFLLGSHWAVSDWPWPHHPWQTKEKKLFKSWTASLCILQAPSPHPPIQTMGFSALFSCYFPCLSPSLLLLPPCFLAQRPVLSPLFIFYFPFVSVDCLRCY